MGITDHDRALGVVPYDADDHLVRATADDGRPRLAVYRPQRVEVVLGRGSRPDREIDAEACLADGVVISRRRGGGCAVVLDPGNVIVSAVLPAEGIGNNTRHFQTITRWLCAALERLGVPDVSRRGISDLALARRKIGGSCIFRTRGLLYYSTTLLVTPDLALMDRYLPHPPREPDYRAGRPHRQFVSPLHPDPWPASAEKLGQKLSELLALNALG